MDTPEKNHLATSSKFEDSPVFNYISNLSPIGPVKYIHTDHTFNSPTFASPSSVFPSPQIGIHKESRFSIRRHHSSDPSKHESSQIGSKSNTGEGVSIAVKLSDLCDEKLEYFTSASSAREITTEPPSELVFELPNTLKYDCGSPDGDVVPPDTIKTEAVPDSENTLESFDQFLMDDSKGKHHSFEIEKNLRQICSIEQNNETCDWVALVSGAADLLKFDSSIDEEHFEGQNHKSVDPGAISFISTVLQLPQDNANDLETIESVGIISYKQCEMGETASQSREIGKQKETDQMSAILSSTLLDKLVVSNSSDKVDGKEKKCMQPSCKKLRSIRRRCLVFETSGGHKNKAICNSNSSSLIPIPSDCSVSSNEVQVQENTRSSYSPSMLPGIGLHLNALATGSNDSKVVKLESLACGRKQIIMPNSMVSCNPLTPGQNPLDKSLTLNTLEDELVPCDDEAQVTENAPQTSTSAVGEEFDQSSPRRKRHAQTILLFKLENVGESKACKRCNCKRSKCLKLLTAHVLQYSYCECFAAGLYCVEPCSCQDCFNKPIHEGTVLETRRQIESRNPLAFAPKVIRSTEVVPEFGDEINKTPASARHIRGCNCKKSSCLKKYCECFQGGVGCSINCRCIGCKNTFGRMDGAEETDIEGEESEACEKNASDASLHTAKEDEKEHFDFPITALSEISRSLSQESEGCKNALETSLQAVNEREEEQPDFSTPPFSEISRPPIRLPFSFNGKLPLSSMLAVGSSPQFCTSQKHTTKYSFCSRTKFETHLQMIPEDETPETLNSTGDVKSTSPNSKRVSPPKQEFGSSTAWSGRKLILRSIPPFPSLTSPGEQ
ncbi:protein tesmin/TSO1-like CXC 3 [Fagus crenata]